MASRHAVPNGFTVRHYCQGIGDCHLLSFPKDDGSTFRMLIDCGIHGSITDGPRIVDDIVADIRKETSDEIDVLVLTHEHTDHNSAFEPKADRFAGVKVKETWMAWTESDKDPQALALDKAKDQALTALSLVSKRLDETSQSLSPGLRAVRQGIDSLLSFNFGVKGEKVRSFRDYAASLAKVRYLEPKTKPITLKGLPNLRIYVLAPSRDEKYLRITERAGEMYLSMDDAAAGRIAESLSCAMTRGQSNELVMDPAAPFDPNTGRNLSGLVGEGDEEASVKDFARDFYFGPLIDRSGKASADPNERDQSWRRIDHDWLASSSDLAMQLDSKTNNTSLVLAFELIDSQRVFLFAADAQIGNWLSWKDAQWRMGAGETVSGLDLVRRAVYYKVGHHGSQNATASVNGLDLMTEPDLAAFIPTNEVDATKVKWGAMPFKGIVDSLHDHCGKRVVRADDPWVATGKAPFRAPSGSIKSIGAGWCSGAPSPNPRRRWVEFSLS